MTHDSTRDTPQGDTPQGDPPADPPRTVLAALKARFRAVPRSTRIYTALLVVLLIVFAMQQLEREAANTLEAPGLASEVVRIDLEVRGRALTLERDAGADLWRVGPQGFRGDSSAVEALLQAVRDLSRLEVVSARGRFEAYGLTGDARRSVALYDSQGREFLLELGYSAQAGGSVYGRVNSGREVVRLPRALHNRVSADADDFRDSLVARVPEGTVRSVELRAPGMEPVRVTPRDDQGAQEGDRAWQASREVDPGRVRDLFQELRLLSALSFVPEEELRELEAGEPFAEVVVAVTGGEEIVLELFPPRGDSRDGRLVPARVTGEEYPFFLPEWRVRRLLLGIEEYLRPFTVQDTSGIS